MNRSRWMMVLIPVLAVAAGVFFGFRQMLPPKAPAVAETDVLLQDAAPGPDLRLMLTHMRRMASEVHSVDTPGIRGAHEYLTAQMTEMGYTPVSEAYSLPMEEVLALLRERTDYRGVLFNETEEGVRDYAGIGGAPFMNLNNIHAVLDAPDTDEAILFMAHTDSVKMGPGAFDDTVSVAALLEGMRLVKDLTPRRDLVFLFTDGEEQGMLGAAKFVQDHPEYEDVTRLVVNVEARGNQGAVIMFETTPDNLGIVSEYAEAVSRPFSFSIATAVYQSMQNDTDLTRFMMRGYPGMNLAVIEGAEVYHTSQDNLTTFSRDSAQHYLTTVTELVRHFALDEHLALESGEDAVHFPLFEGGMAVLPRSAANVAAVAAFALFGILLVALLSSRKANVGRVLLTALAQLAWTGVAFGLSLLVVGMVMRASGVYSYRAALSLPGAQAIFYAMLAVSAAASLALFLLLGRRDGTGYSAAMGTLLVPAVLSLALVFLFPPATYLFSLPTLAGVLAVLLTLVFRPGAAVFTGLSAVLVLLLFVPVVFLVFIALSFQSAHMAVALAQFPLTMLWGLFLLNRPEKA
ncbi:MAG TPA: M20/M25/M40 family metallo-hydrolase [Candidatus Limnocylindria bacterium]|nr:M20/M25/M40 family metallo-hydrolase [Candidatus Limnocylindria bacterium]